MVAEKLIFLIVFFGIGITFIGMPTMLPTLLATSQFYTTLFVGMGVVCFTLPILLMFKG